MKFRIPAIGKQLSFVYVASAINGLMGLVVVPLGLKYLHAEGYGLVGLSVALSLYIAYCDLGLSKTIVRKMAGAQSPEERADILRLAVNLYSVIAVFLLLATPALVYFLPKTLLPVPPEYLNTLRWMIGLAVVDYVASLPTVIRQVVSWGEQRFDRYSMFSLLSGFTRYGAMLVGILWFRTPFAVAVALCSRRVLDIALARWLMPAPQSQRRGFGLTKETLDLAVSSFRQAFAQMTFVAVANSGAVLANSLYGLSTSGIYRAAFDVTTKVWFISNGIGLVVFPYFARVLTSDNRNRMQDTIRLAKYTNASWATYSLIAAVVGGASPYFLSLVGLNPSLHQRLFTLVLVGTCFNAHSTVCLEFLQASRQFFKMAATCIAGLTAMVIVSSHYQLALGSLSLGYAWLASQLGIAFVVDSLAVKTMGGTSSLIWRANALKVLAIGATLTALFAPVPAMQLIGIAVSLVTFLAAAWDAGLLQQVFNFAQAIFARTGRAVPVVQHQ